MRGCVPLGLLLATLTAVAGKAAERSGPLQVIDADTFEVGGATVRLHGVDAPEREQGCTDAEGRPWACGAWATEAARARWEGEEATCALMETDRYGREVSRCRVGGLDLGEALVSHGIATAYRDYSLDYVAAEAEAAEARAGIWRGEVQAPADFRADRRAVAAGEAPPGACAVKGNVSDRGRIYHLPGGRSYAATRIDPEAGERWFCTAAEARAAGWRAARG